MGGKALNRNLALSFLAERGSLTEFGSWNSRIEMEVKIKVRIEMEMKNVADSDRDLRIQAP